MNTVPGVQKNHIAPNPMSVRIAIKHRCTFKGGKPILENPEIFGKDCQSLEGKTGYVVLKTGSRSKSNRQNKYYWGVVIPILGEYFGYEKEQMHSALCLQHLVVKNEIGPYYIKSTRLSEWTTDEWEKYMDYLKRWSVETFGVYIPSPNEVDYSQVSDVTFY